MGKKIITEQPKPEEVLQPTEEGYEIAFDDEKSTATFTLQNGIEITLKEPKIKDFIYFTSKLESAPEEMRTGTMSVFWLSHLMISKVTRPGTTKNTIPDFDTFLDWLEDDDAGRVAAAFSMFPDVMPRYQRFTKSLV